MSQANEERTVYPFYAHLIFVFQSYIRRICVKDSNQLYFRATFVWKEESY